MNETGVKNTEELIIESALKVFTRRGFAAARMEEIAKEAGINRALLHYYYRDKETMFGIIFEARFREFFSGIDSILLSEKPLFEKVKELIGHEINLLIHQPDLPRFIIAEVASQPERLLQYGQRMGFNPRLMLDRFQAQVQEAVEKHEIEPIEGRQLLINIVSLCVYPFAAKPIFKTMMQLDEKRFVEMMEKRKLEVYEFIVRAIAR